MKQYIVRGLLLAVMTFNITLLQADEPLPDNFQLKLGGYLVSDQNTEFKLSKNGVGALINLQDVLDLSTTAQVFRLDGYYRFTPKHRVDFPGTVLTAVARQIKTFNGATRILRLSVR